MSRRLTRLVLALGIAVATATEPAYAANTLTVDPITSISYGKIVLASTSTTTITHAASGAITLSAPAIRPPTGGVTTLIVPVTVRCTDGGGNGCKNDTYTVTISGARTGGRNLTVTSFNVVTGSSPGFTVGSPTGANPLSFTLKSGSQSWVYSFNLGMTVNVSPASASAVPTTWNATVRLTGP